MFSALSNSYKGILFALTGFTAFAFSDVTSKFLLKDYSTYQIVFLNHSMAALLLLGLLAIKGQLSVLACHNHRKTHLFRGFLNLLVALSVIYSFSVLPIADVYTLIFTVPFFSAILGRVIYGQTIARSHALAIIIGFIGVAVAMRPGTDGFDPWLFIPIIAGFLIALKFTISKSLEGVNILLLGIWPLLISAPGAAIITFAFDSFETPSLSAMALHLVTGLFSATGLVCVSQAFRMAPPALVSPVLYTEMIWALLLGYLVFGDVPDAWMLAGAGVIIISGIYLVRAEK